jgi:hypothetical protein
MADRTSTLATIGAVPFVENPTILPITEEDDILLMDFEKTEVKVITIKSSGGIQTLKSS